MTILNDIVQNTREKLVHKKIEVPLEKIKLQIDSLKLPKGAFKENLINKDQAIIAEIKKASPSAGIISENFNPVEKAKEYEAFGASALSILTEEDFFQGSSQFLMDVKAVSKLPIIRKDFMIDEYQIYEAKLMGADCILLIVSVLSDDEITKFVELADSLELDYLIEVHDEDELKRVEIKVSDSHDLLVGEEADKLLDDDSVTRAAIEAVQENGIVFLDEIDKVCARSDARGGDVSREGVQRDLLPLIAPSPEVIHLLQHCFGRPE